MNRRTFGLRGGAAFAGGRFADGRLRRLPGRTAVLGHVRQVDASGRSERSGECETLVRMAGSFITGLELSELFFAEIVRPLLTEALGRQPYSSALMGYGSEVQGFDTERSTDHAWGPRLTVFLDSDAFGRQAAELDRWLDDKLPDMFGGHPVRFAFPDGTPRRHWVHTVDVTAFFREQLGADPGQDMSVSTWLTVPTQVLRELTGGSVFHDGLGVLHRYRRALQWYPDEVWRYVLACQWMRLSAEEPFVGRCAEVGDELGSAVVAARQVRETMRLCLLMDRIYPPYSKWLGTAFARTERAGQLGPDLAAAVAARSWQEREQTLSSAYEIIAALHNERGLTVPLDTKVRQFYSRPFLVLDAYRFADALMDTVASPQIKALPRVGAIDQYVDSTDMTDRNAVRWRRQYISGPPM